MMTVSAFIIGAPTASAQTLSGLQAWWSFDQESGPVVQDASGHGNQGLLIGSFGRRRGVQGEALEFRGRDYMDGGSLPGLSTQQMTLAAHLWVDHAGDAMWIASKGPVSESFWGIQLLEDGRLSFAATWRDDLTHQGQWESTQSVTANLWTHVAVSYDGARVAFYINGQAESVDAQFIYNQGTVKDEALLLGAKGSAGEQCFDGLMDEVRLYNRALTLREVRGLSETISPAMQPDPEDGAQGVNTPLLHWQASPSALLQRVFLGEAEDRLALVAELAVTPGTSSYRHDRGFDVGQTYFWRIDSIDADARVSPGDLWSFTTLGLLAQDPDPVHGGHFLPVKLLLSWTPGVHSSLYQRVYFGTDHQAVENADETWPQYQGQFEAFDTAFDPGQLVEGTTYFWRVDGIGYGNTLHRGDVWHFSTRSAASPLDPALSLWWKLDEGSGITAKDCSGMNNHGQIHNGTWAEGRWGQGIEFDSRSSYVAVSETPVRESSDLTVSAWVYPYTQTHEQVIAWWNRRGIWLTDERVAVTWDGQHGSVLTGDITDEWTHIALSRSSNQRTVYVNGVQRSLISDEIRFPNSVDQFGFTLGNTEPAWGTHFFDGAIDDLRVYSRALGTQEILDLFAGDALQASHPGPAHTEEIDLGRVDQLTWQMDPMAQNHDVYLGEDRPAVNTGVTSSFDVYLGQYFSPPVSLPPTLRVGRTYYWRVDAVQGDASIVQGGIWQFTTARINMIDDFERYSAASPDRIYQSWIDGLGYTEPEPGIPGNGTGSTVGYTQIPITERTIIHGGYQSMPLQYDNTEGPFFSETNRSFSMPQDWKGGGMRSLVLYYWGDPTNSLGPQDRLYLAIRDNQGREQVLVCNHRATLLQRARWHQWKITWDQVNQADINLRAITRLSIGIGNRAHPLTGEAGVIMIDDLGLSSLGISDN